MTVVYDDTVLDVTIVDDLVTVTENGEVVATLDSEGVVDRLQACYEELFGLEEGEG